ncbi:TonB-dependent receptor [Sphingomicrobium sediminis]|uniref:TonB-dependent receptor n=1 Tax=Sphingomicrobium sediminis TaxID=2950949 RepID=A0A9X2EJP9_9SPHN|nr:TonB-dependent receptor [Sphingomicrobium sediminis]MCM8556604.1 TonB-dependent receptor [Sphingomicrobium sediminis]
MTLKIACGASVSALALAVSTPALAQDASAEQPAQEEAREGGLQPIVITATKRSEDLQDVPLAVQAISTEELDELRVDNFEDYLEQLPNVNAGGGGPGQSTIYIRGLASTTPNLTTAGVAGLAPNVALYLDDQPLSQPGRNLDIYAADLQRIEVLGGPQGTLFGASSQAGVVRLITNSPEIGFLGGYVSGGASMTKSGEPSYKIEGVLNVPVTSSIAIRAVGYYDDQGGYIDNVFGTRDLQASARFREVGTVRDNGVPVGVNRAGFDAGLDLEAAGVTVLETENSALVEEDFNDLTYVGGRISALWEINNDWSLQVSHARQQIDSDGVFLADPTLDEDLAIQRFEDEAIKDRFDNTSYTVEGRLADLELVYTGAFTDRVTEQQVDYTDYLFVGQFLPYYLCDTAVVYEAYVDNVPADPTCYEPNGVVDSRTDTEVLTQELRFNTPADKRFRLTAGAFYSDLELRELANFNYDSRQMVRGSDGVTRGYLPNFPLTNAAATEGQVGNESQGYFSDPGPFAPETYFRNDVRRTDEQFGIFGEATFDIVPDTLSLMVGARYYDIEVDFEGSANAGGGNFNSSTFGPNAGLPPEERQDAQIFGTNLSAQFAPDNTVGAPDKAEASGVIFKSTLTWTPSDGVLLYGTYSEGFRPGLLNRPGGADGPNGFVVPFELATDEVVNYEIGWKTELFDRQLRFNGSAFYVDITELQTTIFDPVISNLFFSDNAANAEIMGLEADFLYAPYDLEGLTIAGAVSFLDSEITEVLTPTNDVVEGEPLAFAPKFQGNARVRYEFPINVDYDGFVQTQVTHSASKFTDIIEINKLKLDAWTTVGASAGVRGDRWSAEVFADNIFDERAQVSGNFVFDRARITYARPTTVGARLRLDF